MARHGNPSCSSSPSEREDCPGPNDGPPPPLLHIGSSGSRLNSTASRRVTFESKIDVIMPPKTSDARHKGQWLAHQDMAAIQNNLVQSVGSFRRSQAGPERIVRSTGSDDDDDAVADCIRGIELLCCRTILERQSLRRHALINAVLESQSTQRDNNEGSAVSANILRDISIEHSQADVERALMLAAQDEASTKPTASASGQGGRLLHAPAC